MGPTAPVRSKPRRRPDARLRPFHHRARTCIMRREVACGKCMFFNRKRYPARRRRAAGADALSPRFAPARARIVVAAGRRGVPSGSRSSSPRTRAPIPAGRSRAPARRSPTAAAWSARGSPISCSICSDCPRGGGSSAASCSSSRAFAASCIPRSRRSSAVARLARLRADAASPAPRSRRCASAARRRRCRSRRAARSATSIGQRCCRALFGFNGATLLLLALFAVGLVAALRHVVAEA